MSQSIKLKVYALILLGVIGGFAALCVAVYNKAFTSTVPVYVRADRTGLQMYPGNRVQLLGVDVGEVGDVALDDGGRTVEITLKMDPDKLGAIPANAGVQLNQLTAFGAKTVGITVPAQPSTVRLAANDTLMTDRVTVEVNTLFDHLDSVLTTLQPDKVSAFLGNMAQALQGRGAQIGETAGELEAYLRRFNENLPDLQRTLASGADLTNLYADITPDLTNLLDNAAFTSRTIVDQQAQLDSFFYQVTRLSGVGADFFRQNGDNLEEVVHTALPTTDLLREYSPEFACFLQGMDEGRKRLEKTQGDTVPGLVGNTTFEPGDRAYDSPPIVAATGGPNCNGLPSVDGLSTPPQLLRNVDEGGEPNPDPGDNTLRIGDPPLVAQLFGPLAAQGAAQQGGAR
ncbi:MCE family protein [Pseudonocardia sp. NPDC049154]|uniref:MCE family protein n=1 Tax=Pseudonocardia sp. NPDC049154 TaxID=3155501 RepID=UPI0033D72A9D